VFVVALAVSWLLRDRASDLATGIRFTAQVALRLFASVILAYAAVRAAQHGGAWIALAIVCAIAAAGTFLLTAVIVGGAFVEWRRGQLRDHS
jgi:hypothetical protein